MPGHHGYGASLFHDQSTAAQNVFFPSTTILKNASVKLSTVGYTSDYTLCKLLL